MPLRCCSSSSVGMLFNPAVVIEQPGALLATVAIIVLRQVARGFRHRAPFRPSDADCADDRGKPRADRRILLHPRRRSARELDILPAEGRDLILAGAILSILINPLIFAAMAGRGERKDAAELGLPEIMMPEDIADHIILVGHGRVGSPHRAGALRDGSALRRNRGAARCRPLGP